MVECNCGDGGKKQSAAPTPMVGNPVSLDTATKVQTETDYSTADGQLRVDRHYRGRMRGNRRFTSTEPSGFGKNWLGVVPGRLTLVAVGNSSVEYLPAQGGIHGFRSTQYDLQDYNFVNNSGSRMELSIIATPPPGMQRPQYLVYEPAVPGGPGEIRLDFPNGDYTLYRRVGSYSPNDRGRYAMPVERGKASGYKQYFDYDGAEETPYRIRDNFGRELLLSWTATNVYDERPGNSDFAIEKIDLPDGTSLEYEYDNGRGNPNLIDPSLTIKDRLISVKRQDASAALLWGRDYLYEDAAFPFALTGILDQDGDRLATYAYDSAGAAASTELAGGVNRYEIESALAAPRLVRRTVTNPLGKISKYDFRIPAVLSSYGNAPLEKISNQATANIPADNATFAYVGGLVSAQTNERGTVTAIANDQANGRPLSVSEAVGTNENRLTTITWHPTFDLPTREERDGLRIDYIYDGQGRLTSRTETDITSHSAPYSTNGQSRTTSFVWTTNGRIASINGPLPPDSQGRDDAVTFAYDTGGNLTSITNGFGHVTQFSGFDANGRPVSATDANGIVTTFAYDPLGRTTSITREHPSDPAQNAVTALEYDNEGRVTGITAPLTDKLSMDYDLAGRLLSVSAPDGEKIEFAYDAMSNVVSRTVKRADASSATNITRTFDALGRMLTETLGPGRTRSYAYDALGNPTSITDARNFTSSASFDALDRLVTTITPDSASTATSYDGFDDAVSFTDPIAVATNFVRNGFGEVIQEASPDRGTSVYYYDAAGRMSAAIDGRGQRINYTRDILGRVTQKIPQGLNSEFVRYYYDTPTIVGSYAVGRLSRIWDATGNTRFAYDHRGNLITKQQVIGGTAAVNLSYQYDLADRITAITYPSGRIVNYARDAKGRVAGVTTQADAGAAPQTLLSNATYESFGALTGAQFGNGLALQADWGNDGRLAMKRLYRTSTNGDLVSKSYIYDNDDNITAVTDNKVASKTVNYAYDNRGRLVQQSSVSGALPRRQDYAYDAGGNRTSLEWRSTPTQANAYKTTTYALQSGTNQLSSANDNTGARSFTHDARGNLSAETRPGAVSAAMSYDGYARLTSYARSDIDDLTMAYNGMDDRVMQSSTAATKRYLYDTQGRMLGEYGADASAVIGEYIYLQPDAANDNPSPFGGSTGGSDGMGGYGLLAVASEDSAGAAFIDYVHSDHLGRPAYYTNHIGGQVVSPGPYTLAAYPGQAVTLTDLHYNRYRDYDPTTGRYLQADPIGLAGGPSPYQYALGNPVRYSDPTGKIVPLVIGLGALAGAIEGGVGDLAIQFFWEGRSLGCLDFGRAGYSALAGGAFGAFGGGVGYVGIRYGGRLIRPLVNRWRKRLDEGIYEFRDLFADGAWYVGQSGRASGRISRHRGTGRVAPGTEKFTAVRGGRTTREVAEHRRIQEITGGQRASRSPAVSNRRDPIGPKRRPNLDLPEPD
ncbi:MAG: RHS repeat-associated core domain-containing protein [Sphingorhabdus sp.]